MVARTDQNVFYPRPSTGVQPRTHGGLWTSLQRAPTMQEAQEIIRSNVRFVDFDLNQGATPQVMQAFRQAGIKIFAYNVGDGGGSAWGEPTGLARGASGVQRIYDATRRALLAGADGIHFDNPTRLSVRQLEDVMDAQVRAAQDLGRTPQLHLKNAPATYAEILSRRPDLRSYTQVAVIEHVMSSSNGSRKIAQMGIPVYGVEFGASTYGSPTAPLSRSQEFCRNNPWINGIQWMPNERTYEARTGTYIAGAASAPSAVVASNPTMPNTAAPHTGVPHMVTSSLPPAMPPAAPAQRPLSSGAWIINGATSMQPAPQATHSPRQPPEPSSPARSA